jgi:hypothetical protein
MDKGTGSKSVRVELKTVKLQSVLSGTMPFCRRCSADVDAQPPRTLYEGAGTYDVDMVLDRLIKRLAASLVRGWTHDSLQPYARIATGKP